MRLKNRAVGPLNRQLLNSVAHIGPRQLSKLDAHGISTPAFYWEIRKALALLIKTQGSYVKCPYHTFKVFELAHTKRDPLRTFQLAQGKVNRLTVLFTYT